MIRAFLVGIAFLGAGLLALAIAGLCIITFVRVIRLLPADSSTTSAWIGFSGSIVGSLITVIVAVFALWPAYRQMGETQRSSAVQAGQILRNRWRAAQAETNILMKGSAVVQEAKGCLILDPEDEDRTTWIGRHPGEYDVLKNKILPQAEGVGVDTFNAVAGVDLPDLDRSAFDLALDKIKINLYSILDGVKRGKSGAQQGDMTPKEWRNMVTNTQEYIAIEWPKATLTYNNKINAALQVLRYQIVASDRTAVGPDNYKQFDQWQKQVDSPPS